jgi:hypothetical protein
MKKHGKGKERCPILLKLKLLIHTPVEEKRNPEQKVPGGYLQKQNGCL